MRGEMSGLEGVILGCLQCCELVDCVMLVGCLGISRGWHSNVTHIYCEPQRTAAYGNAAGFPVVVRKPVFSNNNTDRFVRDSVYSAIIMSLPLR